LKTSLEQASVKLEDIFNLIELWCNSHCCSKYKILLSAIFGSSTSKIPKYFSDIDVLFVFESLPPSRFEMWKLTDSLENSLNILFEELKQLGFEYRFSPLIKGEKALDYFNYFYLDLPDNSILLYDKKKIWPSFISRINKFKKKYKAEKIGEGKSAHWNLSKTLAPLEIFEPIF
jgi:predicted nucleotidyltransferase